MLKVGLNVAFDIEALKMSTEVSPRRDSDRGVGDGTLKPDEDLLGSFGFYFLDVIALILPLTLLEEPERPLETDFWHFNSKVLNKVDNVMRWDQFDQENTAYLARVIEETLMILLLLVDFNPVLPTLKDLRYV
jgi:hypothetical protein